MGIMIQFHCVITLFLISTDMCLRTNVPFQYTISGNREQVFLLYYKDFFEQICSDVQFISPPEEVGEFLLHLLNSKKVHWTFFSYAWQQNDPESSLSETPGPLRPIRQMRIFCLF